MSDPIVEDYKWLCSFLPTEHHIKELSDCLCQCPVSTKLSLTLYALDRATYEAESLGQLKTIVSKLINVLDDKFTGHLDC